MKILWCSLAFSTLALAAEPAPLVIASQGSFFVGGEKKSYGNGAGAGQVTLNQMYVQYQKPVNAERHLPVVMVHGCCLSSKTWETTPDGRMGWNEYFVRKGRSVYLADQSSRARSGFDPSVIASVKSGATPPAMLPNILFATHQTGWTVFRFGPKFGETFKDGQFPVEAADELYKQMIPDLNAFLPNPNPTWKNMADLAIQLKGATLMGHSESGFFPEEAALTNASGIRGIISIEQACATNYRPEQIATLARIPTVIVFGDHLGDIPNPITNWANSFASCQTYVKQVKAAGGDIEMMHLPSMGIKGNSHMLMQDRNNLQLADLLLDWIDKHVEAQKR